MYKCEPVLGFSRLQRMQNDRSFETGFPQQLQVVWIVQPPPSGREMPSLSILIKIFRVGQSNVGTEEIECFVEYLPHIRQLAGLKNIGSVHHNFQLRRSHLVEKPSSFLY